MTRQEFVEQLEQNYNMLDNICYRLCCNYSRQDLMQDIALELWKSVDKFKNNCKFSTWFYNIARNVCISTLRKQQQQPVVIFGLEGYEEVFEELDSSPELLKQAGSIKRYNSILETIEQPYRSLFHRYIHGENFKQLAMQSGLNENALRVRIHRIKKQLQLRYGSQVVN